MDETYAQRYRELHEYHWWWRARERFLLARLHEISPSSGFGSILDVGCGDGLFFGRLREFGRPEGIEANPKIVTEQGRSKGRIYIGRFDASFEPGRRYGLIVMLDVLEHLPRPSSALAHAASLLEPGGRIVLTTPAFRSLWTVHDDFNHHLTRFRKGSLAEVAADAGMVIEVFQYCFHWLFFLKLAARLAERVIPRQTQMASVPSPAINKVANGLCRLEQILFARFPLPWGASIFAVLRPDRDPDKTRYHVPQLSQPTPIQRRA